MKTVKPWWKRFISPTPSGWKKVRNISGILLGTVITLSTGITGIKTPDWYPNYSWYLYVLFLVVGLYAQSKEKPSIVTSKKK